MENQYTIKVETETVNLLSTCLDDKSFRYGLKYIYKQGEDLVTTNGKGLIVIKGNFSGANGYYEVLSKGKRGKPTELVKVECSLPFPGYEDIIPDQKDYEYVGSTNEANGLLTCCIKNKIFLGLTGIWYRLNKHLHDSYFKIYKPKDPSILTPILITGGKITIVLVPFSVK